jgi:hypothetical protein
MGQHLHLTTKQRPARFERSNNGEGPAGLSNEAHMLIISAVLSAGVIVGAYFVYRQENIWLGVALCFGASFVSLALFVQLPAVMCQCAFIAAGLLLWGWRGFTAKSLLAYSIVVTLGTYGLFAYIAAKEVADIHQLQKKYAFESMEDRVPVPTRRLAANPSPETLAQIDTLRKSVEIEESESNRMWMLKRLHAETMDSFVNSPGFGFGRGPFRPRESNLTNRDRDGMPVPQPTDIQISTLSETDLIEVPKAEPELLRDLHARSILDFVNPRGFGLLVNRQKVAGFQPHQFGTVPTATKWKVETVDLVSLLMHAEPAVYLSNDLPRMEERGKTPTRKLNVFESAGLKAIEGGDTLYLREAPGRLLLLGAIRSADQCVKCHGGDRGDLLGAFSYRLSRTP